MCKYVARMAKGKYVADCISSAIGKGLDVMKFDVLRAATASTAVTIAVKFCCPLFRGHYSALSKSSASRRCVLLFVDAAMGCVFPGAAYLLAALSIVFGPLAGSGFNLRAMLAIPRLLISRCLRLVFSIVTALVCAMLLAVLGSPLATRSPRSLLVFFVVLAPHALIFGGVLSVLLFLWHDGSVPPPQDRSVLLGHITS